MFNPKMFVAECSILLAKCLKIDKSIFSATYNLQFLPKTHIKCINTLLKPVIEEMTALLLIDHKTFKKRNGWTQTNFIL